MILEFKNELDIFREDHAISLCDSEGKVAATPDISVDLDGCQETSD